MTARPAGVAFRRVRTADRPYRVTVRAAFRRVRVSP